MFTAPVEGGEVLRVACKDSRGIQGVFFWDYMSYSYYSLDS